VQDVGGLPDLVEQVQGVVLCAMCLIQETWCRMLCVVVPDLVGHVQDDVQFT